MADEILALVTRLEQDMIEGVWRTPEKLIALGAELEAGLEQSIGEQASLFVGWLQFLQTIYESEEALQQPLGDVVAASARCLREAMLAHDEPCPDAVSKALRLLAAAPSATPTPAQACEGDTAVSDDPTDGEPTEPTVTADDFMVMAEAEAEAPKPDHDEPFADGPWEDKPEPSLDALALWLATMDGARRDAWEVLAERLSHVRPPASPSAADSLREALETVLRVLDNEEPAEAGLTSVFARVEEAQQLEMFPDEAATATVLHAAATAQEQPDVAEAGLPADSDLGLLGELVNESRDLVEKAEAALLALEDDPSDLDAINVVFRAFHTIKGTAAFVGLTRLSELAHHAESLLSRIRDKEIRCSGPYATLSLRAIDMVKGVISCIEDAIGGAPMRLPDGYAAVLEVLQLASEPGSESKLVELLNESSAAALAADEAAGEDVPAESAVLEPNAKRGAGVDASVRVRTDRLDRLIDTVGELVIAHSMLAQDQTVTADGHHDLLRKVTHTGKILRELQDLTMSMRMVPLKATFQKMARLVRDLAHRTGKPVRFVTFGEDTEIDRNMVDVLNEPLVHMIRNSVDHGIELPDARRGTGKDATGTVTLSARHSGGSVIVELRDDGRGLDRERIVQKAISRGLIDSEKGMTDNEIYALIFEPGFSTADKITDVSGRGVGMDVVRQAIEGLHGRVDINSQPGRGTTFVVRLPLTLAITDGMLVRAGEERYIIPTGSIDLSFRPDRRALSTVTDRGEMVLLRGELMPMYRLSDIFDIPNAISDATEGLLVVLSDGNRRFTLLVDELLGQQQVVAKSLGDMVKHVPAISGAAILGDGRVGLLLDPDGIAQMARQSSTGSGLRTKNNRAA